ncbi:hypothetical protein C8R44DRAFT_825021 [Mycena epipterygia]|nr:hypothetical protein C8R44DRAFT_825021 [Mycena epipterygia]
MVFPKLHTMVIELLRNLFHANVSFGDDGNQTSAAYRPRGPLEQNSATKKPKPSVKAVRPASSTQPTMTKSAGASVKPLTSKPAVRPATGGK